MMIAVDPSVPIAVVLNADKEKPEEEQTQFLIRVITPREVQKFIQKYSSSFETMANKKSGEVKIEVVLDVLGDFVEGWVNFKDKDGQEVEFKKVNGKPVYENWDCFVFGDLIELFEAIFRVNSLDTNLVKN